MKRKLIVQKIAECIHRMPSMHPLRVGIDGVDASGKTSFADEIAAQLAHTQRQIIRASVDDFHQPREVRRMKGELSPHGFYSDSYNYAALTHHLLEPLGPTGDRHFKTAAFDLQNDRQINPPTQTAQRDAILLMDGIFLLRSEIFTFWDLTIYLDIDFSRSFSRGVARDAKLYGSKEKAARRYEKRYIPGQKLYHAEAHPHDRADILIDNNNLESPRVLRISNKLIQSD